MKKTFVFAAILIWQLTTASSILAQQRPGSPSVSQGQSTQGSSRAKTKNKNKPQKAGQTAVRQANYDGVVVDDGHVIHEGQAYHEGEVIQDGPVSGGGGCDSCGSVMAGGCDACTVSGYGDLCHQNYGRFYISLPAHGWVHAEGLSWYQSGMNLPPLVTTSPSTPLTPRASAGVLGLSTTSPLFGGNDDVFTDATGGFRLRFGTWLGSVPGLGIEGEFVGLNQKNLSSFFQSTGATGSQIIARPFFNILTGLEDSELVSYPNIIRGSITTDLTNQLYGGAFRFRRQVCCNSGCGFSDWACQTVPVSTRLDLTLGYRYWQLNESLNIREQLTTLATNATSNGQQGNFDITDSFRTRNQFNGGEVGVVWQGRRGWWSLDTLARVGIGNVLQTVTIDGSTAITEANQTETYTGGFLAQRTNIGTYERDRFTMIPELGATVGYQMTRRLRATIGYTLMYWGNVVRPGDQIDLAVNTNLLPPEVSPFTGALRPQFQFNQTDYWVHGLSFGAEFRW